MMVPSFFDHAILNTVPQTEAGPHHSVSTDDPRVGIGAVFPIGTPCPQKQEMFTYGPQEMELEFQEANGEQ